jgi:FKBP-type peptidyl-prolyl cis-trans isomerase FklB
MKKVLFIALFLPAVLKAQTPASNMDTISYSLGILLAQSIKSQGFTKINAQSIAQGIDDFLLGNDLAVDIESANRTIQNYLQNSKMRQFEEKIASETAFLSNNSSRSEVITLPSGLQYEILAAGEGPHPTLNDKVTVHYHGTLLDGTVFDSSVQRGTPATFGVGQVIAGWVEALQLMQPGAKWKLYIPYDLAYGDRAAGPTIQPFSALIFEVELISINAN